jgi:hypothetical protein
MSDENGWSELYGDVEGGDDDVQTVVEQQEAEAELTPAQRRQRRRDAKRIRKGVEFTHYPEILRLVQWMMEQEHSGISTTMLWLMVEGLKVYQSGKSPQKEIANSLKYAYELVPDFEGLDGV